MKRFFHYVLASKKELAVYGVVGGSGVVLDLSLLIFLKEVAGLDPVVAVIISQLLVVIYNFNLQKHWTFGNKELPHKQFVRYMTLYVANYCIAVLTMYLFHRELGIDYKLVRIGTIALSVSWNFFLYKHWVFAKEEVIHSK